jgi:predicted nucleic acid-binding protein
VGLLDVVLFAFLRLTTNARIFVHPYSVDEAWTEMQQWLSRPCVLKITGSSSDLFETVELLRRSGTAGNLVSDAQIASAALARGGIVHTLDADFARFPGLIRHNPVTGETLTNP